MTARKPFVVEIAEVTRLMAATSLRHASTVRGLPAMRKTAEEASWAERARALISPMLSRGTG